MPSVGPRGSVCCRVVRANVSRFPEFSGAGTARKRHHNDTRICFHDRLLKRSNGEYSQIAEKFTVRADN